MRDPPKEAIATFTDVIWIPFCREPQRKVLPVTWAGEKQTTRETVFHLASNNYLLNITEKETGEIGHWVRHLPCTQNRFNSISQDSFLSIARSDP